LVLAQQGGDSLSDRRQVCLASSRIIEFGVGRNANAAKEADREFLLREEVRIAAAERRRYVVLTNPMEDLAMLGFAVAMVIAVVDWFV
jgi:hypothetical protein